MNRKTKKKQFDLLDDLALVRKYQTEGNQEIIGILFERYLHLVYGVCKKYIEDQDDAKDAVMQIFEKLLTRLNDYEITNFTSWLYVLSRNHCMMYHRNQKTLVAIKNKYGQLMDLDVNLHPANNGEGDDIQKLLNGIKKLSREQQKCVELFFLKGKCYKDICEETGYELKKVKSYIQNGKRNLKIFLQDQDEGSLEK
ncbi:MAG: RNA polymerase sigma factor [Candidatus Cyclobacteriaceae bacterium M3_2C_046]